MKQNPSDPDLATLLGRIQRGDLDLQPEFQRQEIWSDSKKRRLIDTILRDWHVPPIHVVENPESGKQEVLDGQQRLAAIRDFMENRITIDGMVPPDSKEIEALNGLRYRDLPHKFRRKFDRYSLRVIIITEYQPEEPGELFFRLNQQSLLTAPEQRNAFFGPTRDQIRQLVREAEQEGLSAATVGFSNSRMAYDDAIARICQSLENGTLRKKITAADITDRYRSGISFSQSTIDRAQYCVSILCRALVANTNPVYLNKATFHSWLCFIIGATTEFKVGINESRLGAYIDLFEHTRTALRSGFSSIDLPKKGEEPLGGLVLFNAIRLFNDRASSRVADVSSVLARDFVLWSVHELLSEQGRIAPPVESPRSQLVATLTKLLDIREDSDDSLENVAAAIEASHWGQVL